MCLVGFYCLFGFDILILCLVGIYFGLDNNGVFIDCFNCIVGYYCYGNVFV